MHRLFSLLLLSSALAATAAAQSSSSSSSDSPAPPETRQRPPAKAPARPGGPEAGGSAITLESNEALFDLATALNACGYDADLDHSAPVRSEVRAEVAAAIAASIPAHASQDAVCRYMKEHELSDRGRDVAQYISLALYVSPPPALEPTADETEMPPDALQVVNLLPLLRTFAEATSLHAIWFKHHAEYEAITDKVHDPVTKMILTTNIYLKVPVSSYDGRRLLIFVEPMLAPNTPNARIYANDYVLVTSPTTDGAIKMDQIRHLYLHYELEPLVYARATSMRRLTPLLKPVAEAPIDFNYKSDVVALVTECLIKSIEARTMDTGIAVPAKPPAGTKARAELARYDEEMTAYERQAEEVRRKQVNLDMRQGWILTDYFYGQMEALEHNPESISQNMGQMVYGMDVERQKHTAEQIDFLPEGSGEFVRRAPRTPTGLMLAEMKMMQGDLDGAEAIAEKALADPKADHSEATYVKARVALMEGDPDASSTGFAEVLKDSKNPQTLAWTHVYLGRLYDTKQPVERSRAVTEYKAALAVPGIQQDAKAAAETGLKAPFIVPKVVHKEAEEDVDPTGKAEKDAYKPDPPH